jgi:predicted glycosyltransferase
LGEYLLRLLKGLRRRRIVNLKLLVSIGHPADVHVFKHLIWNMEKRGHEIKIVARNKDISKKLLDLSNFDYTLISDARTGRSGLSIELMVRVKRLLPIIRNFNPDVFLSLLDPSVAIVTKMMRKKYISLHDTEHAKLVNATVPFADIVLTPSCFKKDLGKKQIRFDGYKELAYLHPNYFTPDPAVLDEIGLSEVDIFIILRFVSWGAHHDIGQHGIKNKIALVRELKKYGRVFITSEGQLPKELEKYKIKVSPEKLHDLLYYASLYIGEGATTASECAVLGTHAIYVNTLRLGYTDEEEENYNLVYNFSDEETMEKEAFDKALELLENNNLRVEGKKKREILLNEKIDVTAFMVRFIENYPESVREMRKDKIRWRC